MHAVRVYHNADRGVLWWAEGDLGFTGGADTLAELVGYIREWAEHEGINKELAIQLVVDQVWPKAPSFKVEGMSRVETWGARSVRSPFALAVV